MNGFALSSLFASITVLIVGILVFYRNPRNMLHRVFLLFCLMGAYMAFTEFGYRQAETFDAAFLWLRASFLWTFILPLELHFVLLVVEPRKLLESKVTYLLLYIPPVVLSLLELTNLAGIAPVKTYWGWTIIVKLRKRS